ncbi:Glyoxalase/Bleomycin resistance protein/Dihydroxybiphenyl dioxygenase [Saccharata proteae CBS 121410]|uniref:Glyoxalase/Bleomycin resistance protein/Dihydroxybiphenyl dioxygenase n=1 Tax=Saccharata proteae CBS 121410 TaxID=1314787 RepID=A0A9P4HT83_9PEZI|nr:Glyoxalase/Bleomycin resistance protein/Dihydroxybiphenyl dioxygenase [Saccharata proteae CBS 121410]
MAPSAPAPRKINLLRISHVYYTHKDVPSAHQFLLDFGLQPLFYRGYGRTPYVYVLIPGTADAFAGAAFAVESEDDLEYASRSMPDATPVYELSDAPGKGKGVSFREPVDGFWWHLDAAEGLGVLKYNYPMEKQRPGGKTQRFLKRPAPVHKLGHFGICHTNYAKAFDFYMSRFNLLAGELIHDASGNDVTAFTRLDRGSELVDHHVFFFFEGPVPHVHHSSFETHDFDTQVLGHDWLRHRGYENCWGVGRHIMGSQIFDYWFDPSRFILEHYADGDLFDNTYPTQRTLASPDNLHVWGPDLPPTFLT